MSDFEALGVCDNLIKGLEDFGVVEPSEIQRKALPMLTSDPSDFVCRAQTGTGKTATFGLPLLQLIDPCDDRVQGLILAPTRELTKQIAKHLFKYTKYYHRIFAEAVYGGEDIQIQAEKLERTTHIIVATPGRLIDLIDMGAVDLSRVKYVILDEADEMLSRGFRGDIETLFDYTTKRESTWLFSATLPENTQSLIEEFMSPEARHLLLESNDIMGRAISHQYTRCRISEKFDLIKTFLRKQGKKRGMIFCRSRAGASNLGEYLNEHGLTCGVLQGDLSQKERERVMRMFKRNDTQFLVATDVAARGIDIENLAFIVHHQLPDQTEYYVHRSGRTARAGKSGISYALIAGGDMIRLESIQKKLKIKFKKV